MLSYFYLKIVSNTGYQAILTHKQWLNIQKGAGRAKVSSGGLDTARTIVPGRAWVVLFQTKPCFIPPI